ncbi:YbfB/YjiJ family MFS transporter [Rheinheimera mesophila]|uniref:YbfB/YjiJ family MFS transporter n=1 Tax=Rheinheimera mesophila TaxID=1547515 RepID=A0A3P3QH15_9GAMM|nr:YbfB/YjiJ family MFS transporter [Rheinheimera mesophila]KKL01791.1 major facilitator transporter [Rheinheimera mesophila]RRJ20391.1 YbfB/YjiJ family MFS transporter [Rheinheimera mesophila]
MSDPAARRILLAGFFSQLLCLGIARFAYTPLIPLMSAAGLSEAMAGYLAAVNYLGYFAGALLAVRLKNWQWKFYAYRTGLVFAVLSTLATAYSSDPLFWGLWRFLAGLSSAASMLLASGLILQQLAARGAKAELGLHFAGLGLGIALVALFVELLSAAALSWDQQWLALSLLGLVLIIPAWHWLPAPLLLGSGNNTDSPALALPRSFLWPLFFMYFCAGYGYVVTITFIVAMASLNAELTGFGNWAFFALGIGAAPAAIFWDRVARRSGYLVSLRWALLLNALAIVLPVLWTQAPALVFSAFLFGISFVGCVSLMLTMAGRLLPAKPAQLMGKMTLCYGTAQVIAPAISGYLAKQSGSFDSGLLTASAITLCGAGVLTLLIRRTASDHLAMRGGS